MNANRLRVAFWGLMTAGAVVLSLTFAYEMACEISSDDADTISAHVQRATRKHPWWAGLASHSLAFASGVLLNHFYQYD